MDDESAAGPALEASLGWSTTVVDSWLGKNWDAIMKKVDQLNAWESGKKRIH